jgi:Ca-activated chloride channel family protein
VLAVGATLLTAANWPDESRHAGALAADGCRGTEQLHVIAAPSIAPAITTIAADWQATHPAVNGICIRVGVTTQSSSDAAQALAGVSNATIWIPDSTVWSARLAADAPSLSGHLTVGRSVANSPLVVAAAPPRAAALAAAAKKGWAGILTGPTPVALPDPTVTTEGALTLLDLQAQLGNGTAASNALVGAFLHLTERVMPNTAAGFGSAKDYPSTAPAFVASEKDVIAANRGKASPVTTAVYPRGTSAALDYPLVAITPSEVQVYHDAVALFAHQLAQPAAARALNALNLRDANATPLRSDAAAASVGTVAVKPASATSTPALTKILREWVVQGGANQFLAVIDVSGSMGDDSGNGRSKIQVASDAATTAVALLPDAWSAGLWTFSLKPPANDWTVRVPLGSVASNRGDLMSAARAMPSEVGGGTPMYDTALAAFQEVTRHYSPNRSNSVVLMTDGSNLDPDFPDLSTLLAALRRQFNPKKPVSIITVALGDNADVNALQQISAVTKGRSYVAHSAEDIRTVFIQIALR